MSDLNDLLAKLPEIRERRREISPTPWTQGEQFADGVIEIGGSYDRVAEVIGKADAAFIAAAPSDIDALLAIIDALQKANEELGEELSQAQIDYLQATNGGRNPEPPMAWATTVISEGLAYDDKEQSITVAMSSDNLRRLLDMEMPVTGMYVTFARPEESDGDS